MISTTKAILLFFVACTLPVYVMARSELTGKLRTLNNKAITVNSHKAKSGASVSSGSDIQCPEKIGATVDLGELGRIDMAAKTDLRLGFDAYGVTVHLRSGYVVLTTSKGIAGIVTTSEGKMLRTDSSKISSVTARTKDAVDSEPAGAGDSDDSNTSLIDSISPSNRYTRSSRLQ
jgi:hypothetical protein